jgi:hypothetical protein
MMENKEVLLRYLKCNYTKYLGVCVKNLKYNRKYQNGLEHQLLSEVMFQVLNKFETNEDFIEQCYKMLVRNELDYYINTIIFNISTKPLVYYFGERNVKELPMEIHENYVREKNNELEEYDIVEYEEKMYSKIIGEYLKPEYLGKHLNDTYPLYGQERYERILKFWDDYTKEGLTNTNISTKHNVPVSSVIADILKVKKYLTQKLLEDGHMMESQIKNQPFKI